jgi:alkylated DNA repair dioxygenase AlkB
VQPRTSWLPAQASLFEAMPPGLEVREDFITGPEERGLLEHLAPLPFQPFAFHGWFGRRETVSFGWRYDFNQSRILPAEPIPGFLEPLRERAADFAGVRVAALEQALVIRYDPGAGIGWHRDRPVYDKVVGVSLLAPCVIRFRRRQGTKFWRWPLAAQPRSAYLLSGEVRHQWEHSIAPMDERRYSITFRSRLGA